MPQSKREQGSIRGATRPDEKFFISYWPVEFSAEDEQFRKAAARAYVDFAEYCLTFMQKQSDETGKYMLNGIQDKHDIVYRDPTSGSYCFLVTAILVVKVVLRPPAAPLSTQELASKTLDDVFALTH